MGFVLHVTQLLICCDLFIWFWFGLGQRRPKYFNGPRFNYWPVYFSTQTNNFLPLALLANSAFPTVRSKPSSMAGNESSSLTLVFLIILIAAPTPSGSFFPSQYRTLVSLGHSLMTRVANLRASRGDHSGAERARAVAARLERGLGLGLWGMMWSTGWDYFRNYSWGEINWREMNAAVSEMKELLRWVTELTRMKSDAERAAWLGRNYQSVLRLSNSMLGKLLQVFRQSGPLREVAETVKKEVVEGGLLRDCLELGSNDLKGLIQVLNDLLSHLSSASASGHTADL